MLYTEFQKWLKNNCPLGMSSDDFLEFCALVGVLTLQNSIVKEGLTVEEIVNNLFDKPKHLQ